MSLLLHQGNLPQWSIRSDVTVALSQANHPSLHRSPRHPNEIESLNGAWAFNRWSPAADITENEHSITIVMDVPGIQDGMEVVIEQNLISISGCRSFSDNLKNGNSNEHLQRQERPAGRFTRHFKLPVAVNGTHMHTSYNDGVLCISLPKTLKHSGGNHRVWVPVAKNNTSAQN